MPPSEEQRAAIVRDLDNIVEAHAADHELAARHGVSPALVRQIRAERQRQMNLPTIEAYAREIVAVMASREMAARASHRVLGTTIIAVLREYLEDVTAWKAQERGADAAE